MLAATDRDPEARLADAGAFLAAVRGVRMDADLPYHPVPPPPRRTGTAGSRPLRGTRLLDLDGAPREAPRTGRRAWDAEPEDADDEDDLDDGPDDDRDPGTTGPGCAAGPTARVDDVDVAIERIERRRARSRSRRLLGAWLLLVSIATVAAGAAGWGLGIPG